MAALVRRWRLCRGKRAAYLLPLVSDRAGGSRSESLVDRRHTGYLGTAAKTGGILWLAGWSESALLTKNGRSTFPGAAIIETRNVKS